MIQENTERQWERESSGKAAYNQGEENVLVEPNAPYWLSHRIIFCYAANQHTDVGQNIFQASQLIAEGLGEMIIYKLQ